MINNQNEYSRSLNVEHWMLKNGDLARMLDQAVVGCNILAKLGVLGKKHWVFIGCWMLDVEN